MVLAVSTQIWYFGAAGLVSLAAFVGLILVPAVSSYGRWHERFAAGFLSLLIFGGLITIGVIAGLAWVLISYGIAPLNPFTGG
ncbi:MAG TPA: hypothetical protein PLE93_02840 [Solirubrobacterales bacterium]|nr:hypothetical protein [Solirubrobacterales bacterium]